MDFFSSLNQVRKNSSQLDAWEKQQRDKDAQRKAYQEKHAPTQEELEHAKELGDTLINVIDVMDDHSESVAENVETATAGISTITMLAGGGATAYLAWNLGVKPARAKTKQLSKEFEENKDHLATLKKLREQALVRKPNGEVTKLQDFDINDFKSGWGQQKIEQITDQNLKKEAQEISKAWKKAMTPINKKYWIAGLSIPIAAIASWFMGNVYETKLQVDSSRIARFQARRELNDPKSFVNYTPEQIEQAKKVLEKHPKRIKKADKKDNLKKGFLSSIREILRDSDNYNKTKKLRDQKQAIVDRPLTEAEIQQAKRDQEVIQRTVKHINNRAEKYSEQMETAADVIMNTFPFVGGAIGIALNYGFDKSGLIKKWVGNYVNKNGSEEAKEAFKELSKLKKDDPKYQTAWKEFYGEYTGQPQTKKQWRKYFENKDLRDKNGTKNLPEAKVHDSKFEKFLAKAKKTFAGQMVHKTRGKWVTGYIASILAIFPSAILALKLQKDASRAGRFTAKRELEKDPTNFIGYSDDDLKEVKDVKATQKPESKIKEYALFIPRVVSDWWKYNQYRNNEMKYKKALNKELKKLDVSDEQLRNAKNLQKKVFNTFEKIDDKSQAYSEATEAAIETAQPLVLGAGVLAMLAPVAYFGIQAAKGKYTPGKIAAKITGALAASTTFLKSGLFKKYLKGVEKHTATAINNIDTEKVYLGVMMKDIDILQTPVVEIPKKAISNIKNHISTTLRGMNEKEQMEELWRIQTELFKPAEEFSKTAKSGEYNTYVDKVFSRLRSVYEYEKDGALVERAIITPAERADVVDLMLMNKERISKMTPEEFDKAKKFLASIIKPDDDSIAGLTKFLAGFQKRIMGKLADGNKLGALIGEDPEVTKIINGLADEKQLQILVNKIFGNLEKLPREDYIKFIDSIEDMSSLLDSKEVPYKLADVPGFVEKLKDIAKGAESAAKLTGAKAEGLSNLNLVLNPKEGLAQLAKSMKEMDDSTYINFVQSTPMRGWEKESVIKVIENISKVWENIPKEESKRIFSALIKQFNENPDKFVEGVKSGSIMNIFATPQIKKAVVAAGISWTAFTAITTYIISSWLAEVQLRAGRLGVKEAMDDLKDHRYYANIIPEETPQKPTENTPPQTTNDLLAKFKK